MAKLETLKRNINRFQVDRQSALYREAISTQRYIQPREPDIPPEYEQQYYIDAFLKFYTDRLDGCCTYTRDQVYAMLKDIMEVAHREYGDQIYPMVNRDIFWKPELIVEDRDWTIKLGDVNIVTFQY